METVKSLMLPESNINWIKIKTRRKQWSIRFSINFRNKVYRICEWIDMRWNGRKELEMRLSFDLRSNWIVIKCPGLCKTWEVRDIIKHSNLILIIIHDYKASTWRSEVVVVQLLSCLKFFVILWAAAYLSQKWTWQWEYKLELSKQIWRKNICIKNLL